ncbi:MAG: hypothetical protein JWM16_6451 [Verrucomicrobiales bacterium]|nr:hypothetical protein [Verrucomicrobiales bacterium]
MKEPNMNIKIETPSLFQVIDMQRDPPLGVTVTMAPMHMKRSAGPEEIAAVKAVIALGKEVALSLFASWLYDKLKGNEAKVTIGKEEQSFDSKGKILKAVKKHYKKRK